MNIIISLSDTKIESLKAGKINTLILGFKPCGFIPDEEWIFVVSTKSKQVVLAINIYDLISEHDYIVQHSRYDRQMVGGRVPVSQLLDSPGKHWLYLVQSVVCFEEPNDLLREFGFDGLPIHCNYTPYSVAWCRENYKNYYCVTHQWS